MSAELSPLLWQRFYDNNGAPLVGGMLYSYVAGSATPLATYTDETGSTPNANPVVLDANGYASVWIGSGTYKFVLTDSLGNVLKTVDQVQSLAAQIAAQINIAGALAVANNLSDLSNVGTALTNLGIDPFRKQTKFTITSGQAATNLSGETFDGTVYTSVVYEYEVIQGTTIFANGSFQVQYLNGTWQLVKRADYDNGTLSGVTLSLGTQTGSVGQLQAAESGLGNGTLKLKKHYFTP